MAPSRIHPKILSRRRDLRAANEKGDEKALKDLKREKASPGSPPGHLAEDDTKKPKAKGLRKG